jgi:precorrin-2 methylase
VTERVTVESERERLAQVHELLKDARLAFRGDPVLYRAFSRVVGTVEARLGLPRTTPRRDRRTPQQ